MSHKDLRAEIDEEVSAILSPGFQIAVTNADTVPHSDDPAITFPNRDANTQGTKLINTCVLYIDIRRSTDLNLSHRATTVAKLYSAFIRAMTRVVRYHKGHVRGIIGDRLMVIFDTRNAFVNAVNCAIAMNTVSKYIINRHFKANEVTCGIGIDAGNMLATKTGMRRHGSEQANYRNLVWLGRPANVASKLTDIANKPSENVEVDVVHVAYRQQYAVDISTSPDALSLSSLLSAPDPLSTPTPPNYLGILSNALGAPGLLNNPPLSNYFGMPKSNSQPASGWRWVEETPHEFLSKLDIKHLPPQITHKDPRFESFFVMEETKEVRPRTPPILMTSQVWDEFRRAKPDDNSVKQSLFKKIKVNAAGYSGEVYGGDVIFPVLKE